MIGYSRNNIGLVVFLINLLIVGYFWSILGMNYSPVDDDWVSVVRADPAFEGNGAYGSRIIRVIPFLIASRMGVEAFSTLSLTLFSINALTGLGIFLVLKRIFQGRILFSVIASLLIMYFPTDGTMFWMGAFGVNLGYMLCIYSLYFFICAVDDSSGPKFWLAIVLLLASGYSYPGYLLVQMLVFLIFLYSRRGSWKSWWIKASLFVVVWQIGFVKFAFNALAGKGREGAVANFEFSEALNGFAAAFRHLYVDGYARLFEVNVMQAGVWAVACLTLVALYWISKLDSEPGLVAQQESLTGYGRIALLLMMVAPLMLVVGYAPYAVSDIRYGTDRQLLFARPGVVLFYVAIIFWLVNHWVRSTKIANATIVIAAALVIAFSVQSKTTLAQEYSRISQYERIFLGDMAIAMPEIGVDPHVLLYIEESGPEWSMLLNRPEWPIGYMYGSRRLNIVGMNNYLRWKYDLQLQGDDLWIKGKKLPQDTLVISYSLKQGIRMVDRSVMKAWLADDKQIQLTALAPDGKALTTRQRWFVDERNRLIGQLGLTRTVLR